jgi:hypothetical protein
VVQHTHTHTHTHTHPHITHTHTHTHTDRDRLKSYIRPRGGGEDIISWYTRVI